MLRLKGLLPGHWGYNLSNYVKLGVMVEVVLVKKNCMLLSSRPVNVSSLRGLLLGYNNPTLSFCCDFRKSSKSPESQFAVFWKPVLSLDTSGWYVLCVLQLIISKTRYLTVRLQAKGLWHAIQSTFPNHRCLDTSNQKLFPWTWFTIVNYVNDLHCEHVIIINFYSLLGKNGCTVTELDLCWNTMCKLFVWLERTGLARGSRFGAMFRVYVAFEEDSGSVDLTIWKFDSSGLDNISLTPPPHYT